VDWVFVGIMVGSIAYLALIVLAFVENYREGKAKLLLCRPSVFLDTPLTYSRSERRAHHEQDY